MKTQGLTLLIFISLLLNRKEKTPINSLSQQPKKKLQYLTRLILARKLIIKSRQILAILSKILLLLGGIEPNPGPISDQQSSTNNLKFDKSNGVIYGKSIPKTCEFSDCNKAIFTSCHCDHCKGNGPILCFEHFENGPCPVTAVDLLKRTICSKLYFLNQINISTKTFHLLNKINGKFIYICECC